MFLSVEVAFFAANLTKIVHGGWLPLAIALLAFTVLMTWNKGRERVTANRIRAEGPLNDFIADLDARDAPVRRVPGTAVFLNANPQTTPLALRANVENNHVLHERVIIISIATERIPYVADADRLSVDHLGNPNDVITGLRVRYGFKDEVDIPHSLHLAVGGNLLDEEIDPDHVFYFLSQITIVLTDAPGMSRWRKKLFVTMAHNAATPAGYFGLSNTRTITIGEHIGV